MAPSMKLVATFQTLPADTPRLCSKVFTAFCYYLSEAALHTYTPTHTLGSLWLLHVLARKTSQKGPIYPADIGDLLWT